MVFIPKRELTRSTPGMVITCRLRAVPFALLGSLRESLVVQRLAAWMPVGILAVLTATAFRSSIAALPGTIWYALIALGVTVAVHLGLGRRTILSVGIGTAVYVALATSGCGS